MCVHFQQPLVRDDSPFYSSGKHVTDISNHRNWWTSNEIRNGPLSSSKCAFSHNFTLIWSVWNYLTTIIWLLKSSEFQYLHAHSNWLTVDALCSADILPPSCIPQLFVVTGCVGGLLGAVISVFEFCALWLTAVTLQGVDDCWYSPCMKRIWNRNGDLFINYQVYYWSYFYWTETKRPRLRHK